jgi:hypothetical protein
MTLITVNSRAIRAIGHDGYNLYIQFHSGDTIYTYPGVPFHVYLELINSDSPGTYYWRYIAGRYG